MDGGRVLMETNALAELTRLEQRLERLRNPRDAKAEVKWADLMQELARSLGLNLEQQNAIAEHRLRAMRRGGQLIREAGVIKGRRSVTLTDLGIDENDSKRWGTIRDLDETILEDYIAAVAAAGDKELTVAGALDLAAGRVPRQLMTSERDDWETPRTLFEMLNAEFDFQLDVCATDATAKCERYFTKREDGLSQEWVGRCFMNPPYGDVIDAWVDKAQVSAAEGATVVCLVPARTDTEWWWDHCRGGEVRFLRGRLRLENGKLSAPFPSAVVVLGKDYPSDVVWWEAWRG